MAGAHPSLNGFESEPGTPCLIKREDAVLATQVFVEHSQWTLTTLRRVP